MLANPNPSLTQPSLAARWHARTWPCGCGTAANLAIVGVSRVAPLAGATKPNTALAGAAAQNDIASLMNRRNNRLRRPHVISFLE